MIVEQNMFIEQLLPQASGRPLTPREMGFYREPFPDEKSRVPMWRWPRETPIGGEPADVWQAVSAYSEALQRSPLPKLLLYAHPGALVTEEHRRWAESSLPRTSRRSTSAPGRTSSRRPARTASAAPSRSGWAELDETGAGGERRRGGSGAQRPGTAGSRYPGAGCLDRLASPAAGDDRPLGSPPPPLLFPPPARTPRCAGVATRWVSASTRCFTACRWRRGRRGPSSSSPRSTAWGSRWAAPHSGGFSCRTTSPHGPVPSRRRRRSTPPGRNAS